jgi:hypothetical protein
MRAINVTDFVVEETGALILDTRKREFHKGFIPQSINIGIEGDFAPWVGALVGDVKHIFSLLKLAGKKNST